MESHEMSISRHLSHNLNAETILHAELLRHSAKCGIRLGYSAGGFDHYAKQCNGGGIALAASGLVPGAAYGLTGLLEVQGDHSTRRPSSILSYLLKNQSGNLFLTAVAV